jgi:hypothetical protein
MATASKKEVLDDLAYLSDKISTIVRTIAVGLLAVAWGFLVSPPQRFRIEAPAILTIIVCAVVGLLLDWAQYLAGYVSSFTRWRQIEADSEIRGWDPTAWSYSLRDIFWRAKQIIVLAGALVLIGSAIPSIVSLLAQH